MSNETLTCFCTLSADVECVGCGRVTCNYHYDRHGCPAKAERRLPGAFPRVP